MKPRTAAQKLSQAEAQRARYARMSPEEKRAAQVRAKDAIRRWQKAHPEKMYAYARRHFLSSEKRRSSQRKAADEWALRNPDKVREIAVVTQQNRRIQRGHGRVSKAEWACLREQFGHRCAYCGMHCDLTMDHVIPLSRGGEHHVDNIVPACGTCNRRKHARGPLAMVNVTFSNGE